MIKFENGKKYKYEHMDLVALFGCLNTLTIIAWNKGAGWVCQLMLLVWFMIWKKVAISII